MQILKEGRPKNYVKCTHCECEFIYETNDLQILKHPFPKPYEVTYVECPWCKSAITIK